MASGILKAYTDAEREAIEALPDVARSEHMGHYPGELLDNGYRITLPVGTTFGANGQVVWRACGEAGVALVQIWETGHSSFVRLADLVPPEDLDLYRAYSRMLERCYGGECDYHTIHGGASVEVCEAWLPDGERTRHGTCAGRRDAYYRFANHMLDKGEDYPAEPDSEVWCVELEDGYRPHNVHMLVREDFVEDCRYRREQVRAHGVPAHIAEE